MAVLLSTWDVDLKSRIAGKNLLNLGDVMMGIVGDLRTGGEQRAVVWTVWGFLDGLSRTEKVSDYLQILQKNRAAPR